MNKLFILSLFFLITNVCFSQNSLEWEIANVGLTMANQKAQNGDYVRDKPGISLGTAVRLNLMDKALSTGVDFTFTGWNRYSIKEDNTLNQKTFLFLGTIDYNFIKLSHYIQPFIGIGAGLSLVKSDAKLDGYYDSTNSHFAFSPRGGIEVLKRIRLTGQYNYLGNKNNYFNIKLGFVVGS